MQVNFHNVESKSLGLTLEQVAALKIGTIIEWSSGMRGIKCYGKSTGGRPRVLLLNAAISLRFAEGFLCPSELARARVIGIADTIDITVKPL